MLAIRLGLLLRGLGTDVVTDKDRIDYLILRRYPGARVLGIPPSLSAIGRHDYPDTTQMRANDSAYRAELSVLSGEQLYTVYAEERRKEPRNSSAERSNRTSARVQSAACGCRF